MLYVLIAGIVLLGFANGANDNFKGVATLWGSGRYGYSKVLAWATVWAFAGSALAIYFSAGLVKVFSGGQFLTSTASLNPSFPAAVALGTAITVLIANRLGAPISTTHALTGALLGAGAVASSVAQVKWAAAASAIALPLAISPVLALVLTLCVFPIMSRWLASRGCVCVTEEEPAAVMAGAAGAAASMGTASLPNVRVSAGVECEQGNEVTAWNTEEVIHWTSASGA